MLPPQEIELHKAELQELCRKYGVAELALFGSALRSDFRPDSDLDFLVDFKPDRRVGLFAFNRFRNELGDLFRRRVDLVTKRGLRDETKDSILRSARTIYAG